MILTKKILLLLPLGIVLLIATIYHSNNSGYADNTEKNVVEPQIIRRERTIRPATIHYCKFNQYYDQEEGRCLGVPGGGKVLHIENRQSCGINVLKPHCKSSLYYHICKRDKSILAQCANRQIFDNRLQRCVYYDSSKLTPSIITPDDYMYYDHVRMPRCTRSGRFPMPGYCSMFYTCDTNGHRLYQSVFKCPQNTGYQVDRGVCSIMTDCVNDNSVGTTVCVPDAPGENVESPSLNEATDGKVKEISEILEESKTSADDPIVEKEQNVNFKTYDGIITTTPINIITTLSENSYNDNDSDTEVSRNNASSLNPVKEDLTSDDIDEKIMSSQAPNRLETVQKTSDEGRNEENTSPLLNLQITSPLTTELDETPHSTTEQYRNNEDSTVMSSNFNIDSVNPYSAPTINTVPESSPMSDVPPNIDEKMKDAAIEQYKNNEDSVVPPSNFNTDSIDLYPTPISNVSESSLIRDTSSNVDDKMQDAITEQYRNNEDSTMTPSNLNTDSIDQYSIPTGSSAVESSPISDVSPNVGDKMQDAITEEHRSNEDSIVTPSNFNTDSVDEYLTPTDVPEPFPISDVSPNVDDKMQDATTEKHRSNEDSIVTPSNLNTNSGDQYSAPTGSSAVESSPISDVSPNIDDKMQDATMEEHRSNEDSIVTPSNLNTDSIDQYLPPTESSAVESSPISDVPPNVDDKMQDAITEEHSSNEDSIVTPSNLNTDSIDQYLPPTGSSAVESSPISDVSPNVEDKIQDATTEEHSSNEDSIVTPSNLNTDSGDQYSAPTGSSAVESSPISDVSPNVDDKIQDATTEEHRSNEDSIVMPSNLNTNSGDQYSAPTGSSAVESFPISDVPPNVDDKMQDATTEEHSSNEDSIVTPFNLNTNSGDQYLPPTGSSAVESSPISDVPPNVDDKMQDAITEEHKSNEDSIVTPSNLNTDSGDQYSAPTGSSAVESFPINGMPSKVDEELQDAITEEHKSNEDSIVTPSNLNTDSGDQYSASTGSSAVESFPISDVPPNVDDKMQDATTEEHSSNEESIVTPSNLITDSIDQYLPPTGSSAVESSPISDVPPNVDDKMQDAITEEHSSNEDSIVTPSNLNTDSGDQYSASTGSSAVESFPINGMPSKVDEELQDAITEEHKSNEDSIVTPSNLNTDSGDQYSAPTGSSAVESSPISDVSPNVDDKIQDATTEEHRSNEDSIVTPSNLNTDSIDQYLPPTESSAVESSPINSMPSKVDEKLQNAAMEQYKNNEDRTMTPSNFNTDLVDEYLTPTVVPEPSSISDVSPNVDDKMQDAVTEEYRSNEDSLMTPSNLNTDSVDQYSTSIGTSATESSPTSGIEDR